MFRPKCFSEYFSNLFSPSLCCFTPHAFSRISAQAGSPAAITQDLSSAGSTAVPSSTNGERHTTWNHLALITHPARRQPWLLWNCRKATLPPITCPNRDRWCRFGHVSGW
jgi:hypothetical protein